ncbi:phospholipase A2 inhibitor and Ly6/PLAUR domain-containing protein-like [Discoglossus pictus]
MSTVSAARSFTGIATDPNPTESKPPVCRRCQDRAVGLYTAPVESLTMRHLFVLSCFLVFTVIDASLLCMQCTAVDEASCVGQERRCPSHDYLCASTNTLTIMGGKSHTNFTRSCERRSSCGITGTIGFQKGMVKTVISCCEVDSCTPSMPAKTYCYIHEGPYGHHGIKYLPPFIVVSMDPMCQGDTPQRNGLTCASCTSTDSTWCHTEDTIACTGEENRCMLKQITTTGSKYSYTAIRGCATKPLCDVGYQYHEFGGQKITTYVKCTNGGITFHHNLILLAFAIMASVKLML